MRITVEGQTAAEFAALTERTEFVNRDGTVIGYFEPVQLIADSLRARAFSAHDAESYRLHKAATESDARLTTAELFDRLRSADVPR